MTKKILRKSTTGETGNPGEFGTHDHSTPEASLDGSTLKSFNRRTGKRDIEHKVLFTTTGGQYVVVDDQPFGKHVDPYAVYHVGTGLRVPIERNRRHRQTDRRGRGDQGLGEGLDAGTSVRYSTRINRNPIDVERSVSLSSQQRLTTDDYS
jgi:hypothetical protein